MSESIVIVKWCQIFAGGTLAICGLVSLMAVTNPDRAAYENYAIEQIESQARNQCDRAPAGFGTIIQEPCWAAIAALKPQIRPILAANTTCKNSILFTICRSQISIPAIQLQAQVESIGAFDRFYTYKGF